MADRLALGLFDIMQVDPLLELSPMAAYAARLDHLALADDHGLDVAFVAERHYSPTNTCASATAWIAAASQRARTMRLGPMAYTLPLRDPVHLAEEVAVLDTITGGRLEVGFGLGHRPEELVERGKDPADRVADFQQRFAILQALWSGGQVSFDDQETRLYNLTISPIPEQDPHPPLWFAGADPQAAMWAGSRGMHLAVGFRPDEHLASSVQAWRAGREAMDNAPYRQSPLGYVALMRNVVIGETDEEARAEVAQGLTALDEHFQRAINHESQEVRRANIEARIADMETNDIMIVGSPETVARRILAARTTIGFDVFLANPYGTGMPMERVAESIRLLAGPLREALDAAAERTSS